MDKFLIAVSAIIAATSLIAAAVFVAVTLGTAFGAFAGWIVGFVFSDTFTAFTAFFGMSAFAPWQVGAFLGFLGGFIRSTLTKAS
tara:strand:- start:906 stop:1160 length:255 start_codon:yes stop_codon:yes gene_type:complete